jgi:hypothetical protein
MIGFAMSNNGLDGLGKGEEMNVTVNRIIVFSLKEASKRAIRLICLWSTSGVLRFEWFFLKPAWEFSIRYVH